LPSYSAEFSRGTSDPVRVPDLGGVVEQLTLLREQLDAVQAKLAALGEQHDEISALLHECLHGSQTTRQGEEPVPAPPPADAQAVLADCAQDIVRVLHEVGHPLTTLEILEELVRRHASWRENTVRHALTELLDKGVITVTGDTGPYSYQLRGPGGL
jgi:hypothetical protein